MAGLPPDGEYVGLPGGEYVIQQHGGIVSLSHAYGDPDLRDLVTFNPSDANDAVKAQCRIVALQMLTEEQRAMAHFWSGYFYAHADGTAPMEAATGPRRGSEVEAWVKAHRDRYDRDSSPEERALWDTLDDLLDDLRERADLGAPWTGRMIDYGDGRPTHVQAPPW